jgi:exodeoxyribonuclease V alpha subunit
MGLYTEINKKIGRWIRRVLFDNVFLSYSNLYEIKNWMENMDLQIPQIIINTLNNNYFYDKVVSIKSTELTEMYDIEVDNQHSFVSNGFICHNSQGSESPVVIFILHPSHSILLQRNLVYTGITRAKKLCLILGTQDALQKAIDNNKEMKRNTKLQEFIKKE